MDVSKGGQRAIWYAVGCWLVILAVAVVAYYPALAGPFLFDDFPVLGKLGKYGGVVDWKSFTAFLTGGTAGPTGRPVALLSFLIDGTSWPTDSWPFKRTNLVIHLCTASILGVLVWQILRLVGRNTRQAAWIAVVAAAFWLLHPFLVSTTMYVVQRMAQLATLFVFAGLVAHIFARSIAASRPLAGYAMMSVSLVVFTTLATFSKENGALLPILVGVLELTVFAASRHARLDRRWAAIFILVPTLVLGTFLVYRAMAYGFFTTMPPRDYSVYERLLTQPRVLSEYLWNWFIPKLYTTGVFQDHILVSRGLLSPPATLLHLVIHATAIGAAFYLRRKHVLVALAILFFYAGHLVESTTLNLELYFEHRNYLPAAFLFVPLLVFVYDKVRTSIFLVIAIGMMLLLSGFTRYSSHVWADYSSIVEISAQRAQMSTRAQSELAKVLFNNNRYDEAVAVIEDAIQRHPETRPQLVLTRLIILCKLSVLDDRELQRASAGLSAVMYDRRLIGIYEEFVLAVIGGDCPDTTLDAVHGVFESFLAYPINSDPESPRFSQIQYFMGLLDSRNNNAIRAVDEFELSLSAEPSVSAALNIAAVLATGQHFPESLYFVDKARGLLQQAELNAGISEAYKLADIDELEKTILQERDAFEQRERDSLESRGAVESD